MNDRERRMEEEKTRAEQLADRVRQLRDELRLKTHLGTAELKEELAELDDKWDSFKARLESATEGTAENVGEALELLGEEIKKGYEKVKDAL